MRLLTRSDFDGLACAALLKEAGIVNEMKFVHPKDIQDGIIEVTKNDVLANIPYVEGCGLWFDHHSSEEERRAYGKFEGASYSAPSAAQVIYDHYGGKKRFSSKFDELMEAVNKSDSGQLTKDDILNPKGWILLSYIMDPRTGLGRYRDYRISNYQLMENMIDYCRTKSIDEILEIDDVKERVKRYFEHDKPFGEMLISHSRVDGNVVITDLRGVEETHCGNRFMIYCLYPETNISIRIIDGKNKQNAVFAVGYSIINRTSKTDVGSLMLKYGGGGHRQSGTCQVTYGDVDRVLGKMVEQMKKDG